MAQNRKYFGMTGSQVGILAGLAGLVCCLFALAGWLIFGGGMNFARLPANAPTPHLTPTLIVIPTITPTPLPTPIPYEQLIPQGWTQHRTALVELWLPPAYKDSKLAVPKGAALTGVPALVVSQPASKTSNYVEWVIVSYEPLTTDSLDSFLDVKIQSEPASLRVVDRRKESLNSTPAVRITIETRVDNVDVNELAFVFQDGSTVWYVMYLAQINEFYEELGIFEDSVLTFRLVK